MAVTVKNMEMGEFDLCFMLLKVIGCTISRT